MKTREQKIEWLASATNEQLLKQYEGSSYRANNVFEVVEKDDRYTFDGILEDYELVKAELLKRLSK